MSASKKRALREAQRKREAGGFMALPFVVLRSPEFAGLGPHAVKLLFDLLQQYRLDNNGDFSMSFEKSMKPRGWKSKQTLNKARLALLESGFIVISRQGGLHQCSLYAVTFFAVDECDGKLEIAATQTPSGLWHRKSPVKIKSPSTPVVHYDHHLSTPVVQ